jgi:hypothetical protein
MTNERSPHEWLSAMCPHIASLLNLDPSRQLPAGLLAYLGGSAEEQEVGRRNLKDADNNLLVLKTLVGMHGEQTIGDAYRRHMSSVANEAAVAELLSEIAIGAALATLSGEAPELRPQSGQGTACDFAIEVGGYRTCVEVKRYEDRWFYRSNALFEGRALIQDTPGSDGTFAARRPRSMDLISKLKDVPRQFSDDTLNLLIVLHPSHGDSHFYVQAALFGDAAYGLEPTRVAILSRDGLFARDEWRCVSACALARVPFGGAVVLTPIWHNPRARKPLPEQTRTVLTSLRPSDKSLG